MVNGECDLSRHVCAKEINKVVFLMSYLAVATSVTRSGNKAVVTTRENVKADRI